VEQLSGNLQGLSPAQKRMLERIWRRRIDPTLIVSSELASFLCECSREIDRQVGVLVDRKGDIDHVVVGDLQKLYLPDLGPRRAGHGRFRGVRLVHTHLRGEQLTQDDLLDLAKLRLDLVAAIAMTPDGELGPMHVAHLLPTNPENQQWRKLEPISAHELQRGRVPNFLDLIEALEDEFNRQAAGARMVDDGRDRAVLIQVVTGRAPADADARLAELKELCRTAGVRVLDVVSQRRPQPDPRFLIGKGKLDELVMRALQADATLLVFDHDLTPAQARAITDATEIKVIDRTMLILDIFAQHAASRDGKLQVELAQLKYTLPRLQEKNTMMSRLTGGIGGRGPGETKLEINRRRARERIHQLEQEIKHLGKRRGQRRQLRQSSGLPVVSIVGYTNAGKSSLLNTLTQGDVLVEDKLFATLDPTSRRLHLDRAGDQAREVILTDTVGFIRDLPKDLVAAFRATLEELDESDLLVHVVDAADRALEDHIRAVERILEELDLLAKPRILVFNKIDLLTPADLHQLLAGRDQSIAVSARDRASTRPLIAGIERSLIASAKLPLLAETPTSSESP
jgi:GTP-binding protein HflX